ncbi:hypothetical protein C440_12344 [Haloferax mucosum ATCC BAA-1512]|uniref:PGF-CTERM sorting domain-containing protein n=1 Tax=Haloferax mucosum ATCC BAA-1512 TaxID=662479 RepID=M0IAN5_9EURY|nr:BGTF surface domain-containing protein [Haloferax mucosum]ELZ92908.1 hypothetical protein C440_12344 [Haloferax mucosum ATCC BAA-1512]
MFERVRDAVRLLFVATVLIGAVVGGTGVATAESSNSSVSFVTEDGKVTVQPAENQTIRATSDLESGANVNLRVEAAGDTEPFLRTRATTVGEDGNFSATFNFSEVPDGGTFTITAEIYTGPNGDEFDVESKGVVVGNTENMTTETATATETTADETTATESDASTNETAAGTETAQQGESGIMAPGFGIGTAVFAFTAVGAVAFLAGRRA